MREQVRERIILAAHEPRKRRQQLIVLEPTQSIAIVHLFSVTRKIFTSHERRTAFFRLEMSFHPLCATIAPASRKQRASTLKISCDSSRIRSPPPNPRQQNTTSPN